MKKEQAGSVTNVTRALEVLGMVLLTGGILLVGFYASQDNFKLIFTGYTLAFLGYALGIHLGVMGHSWRQFFILALILRIVLLFSLPNLSDDVFRFIWDGKMMHLGIHPLSDRPEDFLVTHQFLSGELNPLYSQLNSPNYYTVYPPVAQIIFFLSTFSFFGSMKVMVFIMKLLLLLGEGFTMYGLLLALRMFRLSHWNLLLFMLNPLAILEIMGNMHFEGLMIAFLLWSGLALARKRWFWSGGLFALAVSTKLLPLMFLPLILLYLSDVRVITRFLLGCCLIGGLLFVPFLWGVGWMHFWTSLHLYYGTFEFNAGLYYILRAIGKYFVGYNLIHFIGPALAAVSLVAILWVALKARRPIPMRNLPGYLLLSYMIYALLSLILHPWYLLLPLFLSVFVPNAIVPVWTYLITLTYINYSFHPYSEAMWVVLLEYTVLLALIAWEFRTTRWLRKSLWGRKQ